MNGSPLLLFPKWIQKVVVQSKELTLVLKKTNIFFQHLNSSKIIQQRNLKC